MIRRPTLFIIAANVTSGFGITYSIASYCDGQGGASVGIVLGLSIFLFLYVVIKLAYHAGYYDGKGYGEYNALLEEAKGRKR